MSNLWQKTNLGINVCFSSLMQLLSLHLTGLCITVRLYKWIISLYWNLYSQCTISHDLYLWFLQTKPYCQQFWFVSLTRSLSSSIFHTCCLFESLYLQYFNQPVMLMYRCSFDSFWRAKNFSSALTHIPKNTRWLIQMSINTRHRCLPTDLLKITKKKKYRKVEQLLHLDGTEFVLTNVWQVQVLLL